MIRSYSSIANLGHRSVAEVFDGPVVVEEKVDGSQFSFGVIDGTLHARSKGKELVLDAPEKMFAKAVETARRLAPDLHPGWTYRGEYLQSPKHNTLAYDRVPEGHVILFDIDTGDQDYLDPVAKLQEARRLDLEVVPVLAIGEIATVDQVRGLVAATSILGGTQVEGVVIKNYAHFTEDHKAMMAKYVREEFKEQHKADWKVSNPGKGDIVQRIIDTYRTEPRWLKGVQHLRDSGTLVDGPQDIGPLLKEVGQDVLKEEAEEIKQKLFDWAWPQIQRGVTAGLPQWYKDRLLQQAFQPTVEV